ncbi:MAG: flagellar biosynthesis protein FlhB [Gammaproteobacteria bacterium]
MAEQDLDRNQAATPYKLRKAKEKGQVAKSAEVVSTLVFCIAVGYLTWQGFEAVQSQFRHDLTVISHLNQVDYSSAGLWFLIANSITATLILMLPFFAAIMIGAIVGNMMQTGPVLSAEPIKLDFQRLNPKQGLKRIFSLRVLFDGARAVVKLIVLTLVAYASLEALLGQFYALSSLSAIAYLRMLVDDFSSIGLKMVMVLALIAMIDLIYTRHEFAKKMRMSLRELKDEVKHRDGDPRIRARIRDLRRENYQRSIALKKTRDADVLITNPTHIAVALKYDHGRMTSPQLLAKGAGGMAAAMREMAALHRIPVVQDPPLARRLHKELPVDHMVPPELYAQVARIIVWVFAMRERRANSSMRESAIS